MKPTQPTIPPPAWVLKTRNAGLITRELDKNKRRREEAVEQTMKEFDRGFDEGTKGFDKSDKGFDKGDKGLRQGRQGLRQRATKGSDNGLLKFQQELKSGLRPFMAKSMTSGFDKGFAQGFEKRVSRKGSNRTT